MSSPNHKRTLALIVTIGIMAIPFAMLYYISSEPFQGYDQSAVSGMRSTSMPIRSAFSENTILLVKNDKLVIGRTALEFKGYEQKTIFIDLYLIDLDNEQPYPKKISVKQAKKEMRLSKYKYRLISVNEKFLKLELLSPLYTF
jgi:hypothetical protein